MTMSEELEALRDRWRMRNRNKYPDHHECADELDAICARYADYITERMLEAGAEALDRHLFDDGQEDDINNTLTDIYHAMTQAAQNQQEKQDD